MRQQIICGLCLINLLLGSVAAQEKDSEKSAPASETIVYSIRSTAADRLAAALLEFFKSSKVEVTAERTNNILLLRVPAASRNEVLDVLKKLDPPARSIVVELQLLKSDRNESVDVDAKQFQGRTEDVQQRIAALRTDGKLHLANHIQLTVVENQKTMLQVGETVAVVVGSSIVGRGRDGRARTTNSYQERNIGTMLLVQAVASDEGGIAMSVQFEQSELLPEPAVEDGQTSPPTGTATMTHQSTLHIKDGHSLLAGKLGRPGDQASSVYLVIGARLQRPGGDAVSFRTLSRSEPPTRGQARRRVATREERSLGPANSTPAPGEVVASGASRRGSSGNSSRSLARDRYLQYFTNLVRKYDTDGDNMLNAEERKRMSRQYPAADANKDGLLTAEELAAAVQRR